MRRYYPQNSMPYVISQCKNYIAQEEDKEQQQVYLNELDEVKNDFQLLINSGIFHDAIGKCVNVININNNLIAEVTEVY